MRSRFSSTLFALVLSCLTVTPPAFSQAYRPGPRQLPIPVPTTPRHRAIALPAFTPQASATIPNFGGFYAAPYYTVGNDTGNQVSEDATITADFNKDGKPDIASISFDGEITLLLNDGKGGFLKPVASSGGFNTVNLGIPLAFAADFNGDGYPDIAIGAAARVPNAGALEIAVSLNQKDGTFGSLVFLPLPNPGTTSVAYSAFNVVQNSSTTHVDLVGVEQVNVSGGPETLLTRFVNNGSGVFTAMPAQTITLPSGENPSAADMSITLADLNGDSQPDLLLERDATDGSAKYVNILLGNSDGTFQQPSAGSTITVSGVGLSYGGAKDVVHVESLTGDANKLDLVLNFDTSIYVALGNGNGTFQTPKSVLQTYRDTKLQFADLNNDGKLDLITSGSGSLITYLGNGDGTFGAAAGAVTAHGLVAFESPLRTTVADFDGDGKLDFANGDQSGHIQVARGNGDGTFIATPLLFSTKDPILIPADLFITGITDLNRDGLPDILAISSTGNYGLITGIAKPAGGFTYTTNAIKQTDFPGGFYNPAFSDFNGDGNPDAVFFNNKDGFGIAISNGDGTFKTPITETAISTPAFACPGYVYVVTGDINGDKKADLVFTYSGDAACGEGTTIPSGYFTVLGNGDGTFKPAAFTAYGSSIYMPALATFHGSGKPLDLVFSDYLGQQGDRQILLNGKGDGTFASPVTIAAHNPAQLIVSDFNQDGIADLTILAADLQSDGAFLYAGNGDGTFAAPVNVGAGQLDNSAVYADVNGDGILDLVGDGQSGLLGVYLGLGKGSFTPAAQFYFPNANDLQSLFAGKLLCDNSQSILANPGFGGGTAFFMNQGGTSLTLTPSATSVTTGTAISISSKLTATLSGLPAPTGTITYNDGSTKLGSEPVGTELSGVQLSVGTHTIAASYAGDAHFNPNTSSAVTVTVTAPPPPPMPDFTFTASASTLQITKGSSGTLTLSVAANSTLSGNVTFACSGLPGESTCTFSPSSLTGASSASGSSTLTITTKAASSNQKKATSRSSSLPIGAVAAAGLLALCLPRKRIPSIMALLLMSFLTAGSLAALSGCGGGSNTPTGPTDPGTPQGTSSVTVTATAVAGTTTVTHTSTISLTVQ